MKLPMKKKKEKNSVSRKIALRGGSYSIILTALVLVILVVVNIMVSAIPTTYTKLDISSANLYSITSNTKVVVNALDQDVTIYWIVQAGEEDDVIENLLGKYEGLSDHIRVEKKNPDVYPTFAEQYTDDEVANNSLVVECGDKNRYIGYDEIYITDIDYSTYSYVSAFDGEAQITSAINYVTSEDLPKVYTLEGHGEAELPDEFSSQMEKDNLEVDSFSLLNEDAIPDDADCIMIYAPSSDISEDERDLLEDYVTGGGRLLVISGPVEDGELTNLNSLLEYYSISTSEGIVVEGDRDHYAFEQPYVLLPDLQSSTITDPLIEDSYHVILPVASGLTIGETENGEVTQLMITSDDSFSKIAGYSLETYDKEDGDIDGPFSLAVQVTDNSGGEMIWIASSVLLDETYNAYSSGANLNFVMNAMSELIGETDSISIRSKSLSYNYLTVNATDAAVLKTVMIFVLPAAFVLAGIVVLIRRRQRRSE